MRMRQADELRRQVAEIRQAAQYADRLEGKVKPALPPVQPIGQEERDKARRARVDEAFAHLERRLGIK